MISNLCLSIRALRVTTLVIFPQNSSKIYQVTAHHLLTYYLELMLCLLECMSFQTRYARLIDTHPHVRRHTHTKSVLNVLIFIIQYIFSGCANKMSREKKNCTTFVSGSPSLFDFYIVILSTGTRAVQI